MSLPSRLFALFAFMLFNALAFSQAAGGPRPEAATAPKENLLTRHYKEGEKLRYHMKASNRDRVMTHTYEIDAESTVKKDAAGRFIEEVAWSNWVLNGKPVSLAPPVAAFRQVLSLEPHYPMGVPDLSQVIVIVGPITDLLTIYADMSIKNQGKLEKSGDHFYFKHGTPASWADGSYAVLGEDSIDFEVTLADLNPKEKQATLLIRHVPPKQPQIKIPADWMHEAVADTPNNWVEVTRRSAGKYFAEVGKETFDVQIKVSLQDGKILWAAIDNPVEVKARECTDAALMNCGEPMRYQILRKIELKLVE